MKKIILITVFALGFIMNLNAQNDGFFSSASAYTEYREEAWWQGGVPSLPGTHGVDYDTQSEAPIGSGLLILAGMGLGYAFMRKKRD